jgi:hypothetical protein
MKIKRVDGATLQLWGWFGHPQKAKKKKKSLGFGGSQTIPYGCMEVDEPPLLPLGWFGQLKRQKKKKKKKFGL